MSVTGTVPWLVRDVPAMGSTAELMVMGEDASHLLEWAVERVAALERRWSRFLAGSDVARLERGAGTGPVAVAPETVEAVGRAVSLWYVTHGRFDPTVRRALEANGYDRTFSSVAPDGPALTATSVAAPGCDGIRIDRSECTVSVPDGVALDLGGVGKGLAADIVVTGLVERGAHGACVAMGGDVRVAGRRGRTYGWTIEVEDPFDESRALCSRTIVDGAIVTSTTRYRRWRRGDRELHHIIDPATGTPADRGVTAVIAEGDDAWWAEGVAKAALVAGVDDGLMLLERLGVAGVVVGDDGERYESTRWTRR